MFKNLCFVILCSTLYLSPAQAMEYGPAFDKDVKNFTRDILGGNYNAMEEAIVQLQWAGISDPRIFDAVADRIQSNPKAAKNINTYIKALAYSGNPKYLPTLQSIIQDDRFSSSARNTAEKYSELFNRYQAISEDMNRNLDSVKTNEELWAKRHERGLRTGDREKVRWAARDLYLHSFSKEDYDVAAAMLEENYDKTLDDPYTLDSMAFLCKALGLSRRIEYKDILIKVSDNAPNEKLARYAERSTQYFDPTFKMKNPHIIIKKKVPIRNG